MEPDTAACVLASLTACRPVTVPTATTVMAGLNCGTVSSSAWPVLRDGCDAAVAVTDEAALLAVDDLARPASRRDRAAPPPWPASVPPSRTHDAALRSTSPTMLSSSCSARKDGSHDHRPHARA